MPEPADYPKTPTADFAPSAGTAGRRRARAGRPVGGSEVQARSGASPGAGPIRARVHHRPGTHLHKLAVATVAETGPTGLLAVGGPEGPGGLPSRKPQRIAHYLSCDPQTARITAKRFNEGGIEEALRERFSGPRRVHAAFDEGRAAVARDPSSEPQGLRRAHQRLRWPRR